MFFLEGNQTSKEYIEVLGGHLLAIAETFGDQKYLYQ